MNNRPSLFSSFFAKFSGTVTGREEAQASRRVARFAERPFARGCVSSPTRATASPVVCSPRVFTRSMTRKWYAGYDCWTSWANFLQWVGFDSFFVREKSNVRFVYVTVLVETRCWIWLNDPWSVLCSKFEYCAKKKQLNSVGSSNCKSMSSFIANSLVNVAKCVIKEGHKQFFYDICIYKSLF